MEQRYGQASRAGGCYNAGVEGRSSTHLIRWSPMILKLLLTCFAGLLLASCASADRTTANNSERIADMPQWLDGLPPGVPPRTWHARIRCCAGRAGAGSGAA